MNKPELKNILRLVGFSCRNSSHRREKSEPIANLSKEIIVTCLKVLSGVDKQNTLKVAEFPKLASIHGILLSLLI